MKIATVFIVLCCFGATIKSSAASFYGSEITTTQQWWNDNYYLKFNSPGVGKTFYINFYDGTISREKKADFHLVADLYGTVASETTVPLSEKNELPFITFVSVNLNIYDIYFECDDGFIMCIPRLEDSKFIYENKYILIRHRLESFVGPNKKLYQIVYNNDGGNDLKIIEKPSQVFDHFQIKTVGPYEKWEHTYEFSEDGELVLDHTITRIPVLAGRSILLPKLKPDTFIETNFANIHTFLKYRAPGGTKYHITNQLDIIQSLDDDVDDAVYITFAEPNGRTYDIVFEQDNDHPVLVEKSMNETYFAHQRLHSFIAPNGMLYRIDSKNESGYEVPVLVSNSIDASDLQKITLLRPAETYNMFVEYIFSDNGTKLFDRVDEIDWTPLDELPAIPVEEVTEDYANVPFLTLYTPSGNNYHIFTNGTNASIAVEKVTNKMEKLYISYLKTNSSKSNIYFTSGDHPYLEDETGPADKNDLFSFSLKSFVTPNKKEYSIEWTLGDDNKWEANVRPTLQDREPIDLTPVGALSITIKNENGWEYIYRFTWNGDKLIEALMLPPSFFVPTKVLQSLIGK